MYPKTPIRSLYIYATVFVAIFVVAIAWYLVPYSIVRVVQAGSQAIMQDMETNSSQSNLADTFFTNIINYFLIIFLFVLAYWVYSYSQKTTRAEAYYVP